MNGPASIKIMDLIILSEVSQRGQIPYDITYMWYLKKNDENELI